MSPSNTEGRSSDDQLPQQYSVMVFTDRLGLEEELSTALETLEVPREIVRSRDEALDGVSGEKYPDVLIVDEKSAGDLTDFVAQAIQRRPEIAIIACLTGSRALQPAELVRHVERLRSPFSLEQLRDAISAAIDHVWRPRRR